MINYIHDLSPALQVAQQDAESHCMGETHGIGFSEFEQDRRREAVGVGAVHLEAQGIEGAIRGAKILVGHAQIDPGRKLVAAACQRLPGQPKITATASARQKIVIHQLALDTTEPRAEKRAKPGSGGDVVDEVGQDRNLVVGEVAGCSVVVPVDWADQDASVQFRRKPVGDVVAEPHLQPHSRTELNCAAFDGQIGALHRGIAWSNAHQQWFSDLLAGKFRINRTERKVLRKDGKQLNLEFLGAVLPKRNAVVISALDNSEVRQKQHLLL